MVSVTLALSENQDGVPSIAVTHAQPETDPEFAQATPAQAAWLQRQALDIWGRFQRALLGKAHPNLLARLPTVCIHGVHL